VHGVKQGLEIEIKYGRSAGTFGERQSREEVL